MKIDKSDKMNNQAMRLYKAVERLALQAGENTDETIDWLCGENCGMFKLFEAYFSPKKPTCKYKLTKPLTDEERDDIVLNSTSKRIQEQ